MTKLITKDLAKKFPALYETDGVPDDKKMVVAKFFGGRSFTFYAFEANAVKEAGQDTYEEPLCKAKDYDDIEFFGYVTGVSEPELTYMNLSQLQSMKFPPFGLGVERDLYYTPESLADIKKRGY